MPKASSQTAASWRRTRQLKHTLMLASLLDGTRTVPEAAEELGMTKQTAYRILASLRNLAEECPDFVEHDESKVGRNVLHCFWIKV
jgi:hypothetical protein